MSRNEVKAGPFRFSHSIIYNRCLHETRMKNAQTGMNVNTNTIHTGLRFGTTHAHNSNIQKNWWARTLSQKMAAKLKNKRWLFDDDITANLVECLKSYKVDKESGGIDFEVSFS